MKITKSTSLWQNSGANIGEKANFWCSGEDHKLITKNNFVFSKSLFINP